MTDRRDRGAQGRRGTVRLVGAVAALALVGVTASDFVTSFWVDHPMVTANLSALLLLIVGVAVVNEYLAARSRRQWETVAALAVTQLRDQIRIVITDLGGTVLAVEGDLAEISAAVQTDRRAVDAAVTRTLEGLGPEPLVAGARRHLAQSQDLAREWAPVMVNESRYAGELDAYVDILNRVWRIIWALSPEERGDREAPPVAAIATEYSDVVYDALILERNLTDEIRTLLPWPASFGPPPSSAGV